MCKIVGYEKLFLCLMLIEMTFEVRRYSNGLRAYVFSDPNSIEITEEVFEFY